MISVFSLSLSLSLSAVMTDVIEDEEGGGAVVTERVQVRGRGEGRREGGEREERGRGRDKGGRVIMIFHQPSHQRQQASVFLDCSPKRNPLADNSPHIFKVLPVSFGSCKGSEATFSVCVFK